MAWVIDNKTIETKDDLRGMSAAKVWGAILYAATERYNFAYPATPITDTLEDCETYVRRKRYFELYSPIYNRAPIYYGYNQTIGLWCDPDGGDGNGDYSGLDTFPTIELDYPADILPGDSMADAAWAHIERLNLTKYLAISGHYVPTGLCGITATVTSDNPGGSLFEPDDRTFSLSKSTAVAVDFYTYEGDRFGVTVPLQLQRSSPASECSFTLSGFSGNTNFALVAKPEFQYS